MPRYVVVERRVYEETYLIEAENEDAAQRREGHVLDEFGDANNSHGLEIDSCEEVGDDVKTLIGYFEP